MDRRYGSPNSIVGNVYFDEKFNLSLNAVALPNYGKLVEKLLNNNKEARMFLKNTDKYLEENGVTDLKEININDKNLELIRVIGDAELSDCITRNDAKRFIEIMRKDGLLPDSFISLNSKIRNKEQAAYVPVIVTPALAYTSFGAVAWVVALVAAAAAVGVKVKTVGKQLHRNFQSNILHPKVSSVLSIAILVSGEKFAHSVDKELWDDFWLEVMKKTDRQYRVGSFISDNLG